MFALDPYFKYETDWIGLGACLYLGNNYWAKTINDESFNSNITTSARRCPVFPQAYLRFGQERTFFGDIGIAYAFPNPFPGMRFEAAIGSGFGLPRGNKSRFGGNNLGTSIQSQVLISEKFLGSATYQWGKEYLNSGSDGPNRQVCIGHQYRILK